MQKVNTFNMDDIKTSIFLDLMNAGYKNAWVSIMEYNFGETQIEINLQNVGSLCVNQSFLEINDEQHPNFEISYTIASQPNVLAKIESPDLMQRAVRVAYDCKKYFESHPEHAVDEKSIYKKIKSNQKFINKQYAAHKHFGILQTFIKEK